MSCSVAVPSCPLASLRPRAMRRCECAEVPFDQIAQRVQQGAPLDEVVKQTGCGQICTSCIPDLEEFLVARAG